MRRANGLGAGNSKELSRYPFSLSPWARSQRRCALCSGHQRETKAQKLRQVPIHPELKRALELVSQASPYEFCNRYGQRDHRSGVVRMAFDQLRRDLGMPELTFHMLRHNFASELIAKGADVRTVQEYMGHSSLRMLQRYAHVNKGIWRSTIQMLGQDATNTTLTLRSKTDISEQPSI